MPFALKEFSISKELVFDTLNFNITGFKQSAESSEYEACEFILNNKTVQFRTAKITPTKTGQFVTIWKRNSLGITAPFEHSDDIDFIIIACRSNNNFGHFIFPKAVLVEMGIIADSQKAGKHGIRVYPPWDVALNKQAIKTQSWQANYFVNIDDDDFEEKYNGIFSL
jgi:hypothetical protein